MLRPGYTYKPNATPMDDSFTFRASDGSLTPIGHSQVTISAVNDAPAPTAPALA